MGVDVGLTPDGHIQTPWDGFLLLIYEVMFGHLNIKMHYVTVICPGPRGRLNTGVQRHTSAQDEYK